MKKMKSGSIQVLENKEDWLKAYYYFKGYAPDTYPKRYPCILIMEQEDGGLGGDYVSHKFSYFPSKINLKDYFDYFIGFVNGYESKA